MGSFDDLPARLAITCFGWKSLPEPDFVYRRRSGDAIRPSCGATYWRRDERLREEPTAAAVTVADDDRGGFPRFQVLDEPPGFRRFVTIRRARDLAVAADAPTGTPAADFTSRPHRIWPRTKPGGMAPAGRAASLPGGAAC